MRQLKIAICGIRGIPACYGGFETFAEELSSRLVKRGHKVRVYGRRHVIGCREPFYKGVELRLLFAPQHKYLETPLHTFLCLIDLCFRRVDAVLVCNAANSPFVWLPRLAGMPVAVNVDGIERMRKKWNVLGKWWYSFGEKCSIWFASKLIADAEVIRDYYQRRYQCSSSVIPYGCIAAATDLIEAKLAALDFTGADADVAVCKDLGLTPGQYILYVSRLEPENNAHIVIEAYNSLPADMKSKPLVIVGDAPYAQDYIARIKQAAGPGVVFAGFRFGQRYAELQQFAYLYVQATEVGGTHPALVESMGFANCVLANDTPENREVLGECGIYYQKNNASSLRSQFMHLAQNPDLICSYRRLAYQRAQSTYDWESITTLYERLFFDLLKEK